ncbi:cytochrome c oxidase assembly protein [Streptosporangium sp. 'caverna']|uniref:cytochrome c oxidase assembly protein n=1 Tax=Streptosporangium sp. 'caverna' TaxID=2202249 RepID=UPI000D7DAA6D|nr:cytochrome c oxidase assembly protein [Streptosporangium sp. 'caverna']AWS48778.1 cytochrome c oxidase assembly protein [Streptosporangium sp. 'caverna']
MIALSHEAHHHGGGMQALLPLAVLAVVLGAYGLLAARRSREAKGWSRWRTASFAAGIALVAGGVTGPVAAFAETDFRGHMLQHLLIGMLAPLGLVLSAPMTLLLRSLPPAKGRRVGALLRSRVMHLPANPWIALVLSVGGMVALYCTPLYRIASADAPLHHLVHVHFLLAGCLFAWVIAGPDPAPRRPSVPVRLVVLGVAVAVHATLSQLMYAGLFVDVPVPPEQLRGAAEIMYYGGDIAELLLALALVSTWRPARAAAPRPAPAVSALS